MIVRLGRAVRIDPPLMVTVRDLAESARLRPRYIGMRFLKPITERLLDAERRRWIVRRLLRMGRRSANAQ